MNRPAQSDFRPGNLVALDREGERLTVKVSAKAFYVGGEALGFGQIVQSESDDSLVGLLTDFDESSVVAIFLDQESSDTG